MIGSAGINLKDRLKIKAFVGLFPQLPSLGLDSMDFTHVYAIQANN